jgi:hypothetical protein
MKNFLVRIKISMPDGPRTHVMRTEGVSLEDAMLRFGLATDGNDFMAVKCFIPAALTENETTYGVVFPLSSVLEVQYLEV